MNDLTVETDHPTVEPIYYAITLTADEDGHVFFDTQTYWVGWADEEHKVERRRARPVHRSFVTLWERARQPYRIIENIRELGAFFAEGGNALVEQNLGEAIFETQLLTPDEACLKWPSGFRSRRLIEDRAFQRAPSPKLRMTILARDGLKCRICGRRPETNTDIELHVHHIRPWAEGGLTEPDNLITLCHTCHAGLDPHYDRQLHEYVTPPSDDPVEAARQGHLAGVQMFRENGGYFAGISGI